MLLLPATPAFAHGGQYRGPVPVLLSTPDLSEWTFWWEFNKDAYLVRKAEPALGPDLELIVSALIQGLEETGAPEIPCSCLIALAKIGQVGDLAEILKRHCGHTDPRISETALIASGIAASERALPYLLEVFKDTPRGRELVGLPRVDLRRQSFAGYALGMIGGASRIIAIKRTVYQAAREILEGPARSAECGLAPAAIDAMRILDLDPRRPGHAELALEAARCLLDYLKDEGNRSQARTQVPTAVAGLLGRDPGGLVTKAGEPAQGPVAALRTEAIQLFSRLLREKDTDRTVVRSCALALGRMGSGADRELVRLLDATASGELNRDFLARRFALIGLGSLGGEEARCRLIAHLAGPVVHQKAWAALALGILAAASISAGRAADPEIGEALTAAFERMKNPAWRAGMAVALGLARHQAAGPKILDQMNGSRAPDEQGYYAVALGLMGYRDAIKDLRALLNRSNSNSELLKQVAIGLGLLGDPSTAPDLVQALTEAKAPDRIYIDQEASLLAAQASAAIGLGLLGAPGALERLVEVLEGRERFPPRMRAFAAAALGRLCDRAALPWNTRLGVGLNYRAFGEILGGKGIGLLDLL